MGAYTFFTFHFSMMESACYELVNLKLLLSLHFIKAFVYAKYVLKR